MALRNLYDDASNAGLNEVRDYAQSLQDNLAKLPTGLRQAGLLVLIGSLCETYTKRSLVVPEIKCHWGHEKLDWFTAAWSGTGLPQVRVSHDDDNQNKIASGLLSVPFLLYPLYTDLCDEQFQQVEKGMCNISHWLTYPKGVH